MAEIKNIVLSGDEIKVNIAGQNCDVRNDGAGTIYASCKPEIVEGADGVVSIPAGSAVKLLDSNGTVYLLGAGAVTLCGNDYAAPVFKVAAATGGSGEDSVARAAIAAHEGNGNIHLTAEQAQAAAAQVFSNPNLLINPDFRINQRGETEYETSAVSTVYSVDRWRMGQGTVLVAETGIILHPNSVIFQLTENKLNAGIQYTVSVCLEGGNAEEASFVCKEDDTYSKLPSGINVKLATNGVMIYNPTSFEKMLLWAKAEIGNYATPFVPPDPATELAKCQRYYQIRSAGDIPAVDLRPAMRATPTVTQLADGNYAYDAEL